MFHLKMTNPNSSIPDSLLYPCPFMHPKLTSPASVASINLALTETPPENIHPGDKTPITARSPAPFILYC